MLFQTARSISAANSTCFSAAFISDRFQLVKYNAVLYDFLFTVKAAPHECVNRTGLP